MPIRLKSPPLGLNERGRSCPLSQSLSEKNIISCYHRSKSSVWSRIASVNSRASHLYRSIDEVYDFLAHSLIPHAEADEAVLYPAVGKALGTPQATIPMSRDHVEVSRLTEQLRILRSRIFQPDFDRVTATELRRVLYDLYSVVKASLRKRGGDLFAHTG